MLSGTCRSLDELPPAALRVLSESGRAVLGTRDDQGRPHLVPVTFAIVGGEVVTAIDHKPKRTSRPARLLNVQRDPVATILFDRYDDRWRRLGWVMARAWARVEPPGFGAEELSKRYEAYRSRPPEGEVIVLTPEQVTYWLWERDS